MFFLYLRSMLTLCRFSIFQVVGAWANTGMSLVDQNLVPFQTAYPMIFVLIFLVMAGNTAFVSECAYPSCKKVLT